MVYSSLIVSLFLTSTLFFVSGQTVNPTYGPEYLNCEFTNETRFCGYNFGITDWSIDHKNGGAIPSIMLNNNELVSLPITLQEPACLQVTYRLRATGRKTPGHYDLSAWIYITSRTSNRTTSTIFSDDSQKNFTKTTVRLPLDTLNEPLIYEFHLNQHPDNFAARKLESVRVGNGPCGDKTIEPYDTSKLNFSFIELSPSIVQSTNYGGLFCNIVKEMSPDDCRFQVYGFDSTRNDEIDYPFYALTKDQGVLKSRSLSANKDPVCLTVSYFARSHRDTIQKLPVIAIKTLLVDQSVETIEKSTYRRTNSEMMMFQFTMQSMPNRYQIIIEMNRDENDTEFQDLIGIGQIGAVNGACSVDVHSTVESFRSKSAGLGTGTIVGIVLSAIGAVVLIILVSYVILVYYGRQGTVVNWISC